MKRRLAAGGVVLSLLAILALGTAAYFSTNGRAQNEITMGTVAMTLTETVNGVTVDEIHSQLDDILPGQTIDQVATIENSGNQAYWLRVKTDVQIIGEDDKGLDNTLPTGEEVITFNIGTAEPLDGEPTGTWIEKDGWYYFPAAVAAGEKVSPFDKVTFAAAAGNDYQGCTINIRVDAQAVQVKHNLIPDGGSVLDVKGWPDDTDPGVEPGEPVPGGGGTVTP